MPFIKTQKLRRIENGTIISGIASIVEVKFLHDLKNTIILFLFRKHMDISGISTTELFGRTQSLMCFRNDKGIVTVKTPNKLTKEYYSLLDLTVPSHVKICEFRNGVLQLK